MVCTLFSSMYKMMLVIWAIISFASSRKDCTFKIKPVSYSPHKWDKKICIRISNSYFAALARICFHFSGGLSASCTSSTCFRERNGYYPPGKQFNGPETYRKTCWFCSYCVQKGKSLSDACVLLCNLYQNLCMHIVNWILYSRIIPKSVFTVISCAFPSLIKQKLGFV